MKMIFAFVGGVASGIAGAYIFLKNKYEQDLEKEIAEFKKEYRGVRLKEDKADNDRPKENYKTKNGIPEKVRERVDAEKVSYDKIRASYIKPDISEMYAEDVLVQSEHPEDGDEEDIRLISLDEFMSDTDFHKESLIWYAEDDVLTDSYGDIIDDTLPIVGEVMGTVDLKSLPVKDSESSVFIRNANLNIDYEVEVIRASHEAMTE